MRDVLIRENENIQGENVKIKQKQRIAVDIYIEGKIMQS